MSIIKFHKKYYLKILDGDKTQTMRFARKRLKVNVGDIVTACFPGFDETVKIRISRIGYKQVKSITDDDAQREGFETKEELLNDLKEFYPNMDKFDRIYYYGFELC